MGGRVNRENSSCFLFHGFYDIVEKYFITYIYIYVCVRLQDPNFKLKSKTTTIQ